MKIKQFVPSDFCLKCPGGCCRFQEKESIWAPPKYKGALLEVSGGYLCPKLDTRTNRCQDYASRPFDCALYPFLLVRRDSNLFLGLHKSCVFIEETDPDRERIKKYAAYLKNALITGEAADRLKLLPEMAAAYGEDVEILFSLETLYKKYLPRLRKLALNDRVLCEKFLKSSIASIYNFTGIILWNKIYNIFWAVIDDCLCVFYQDNIGMFMILPPQGSVTKNAAERCFEIMDFHNKGSLVSRIENVEEKDIQIYRDWGFSVKPAEKEFICLRHALSGLSGARLRHKRAGCNLFLRGNDAQVLEYEGRMEKECLSLYRQWMEERKSPGRGTIYCQMLEDSFLCFKSALKNYKKLNIRGCVVKAGGSIKACSFGYALSRQVFCVLFEVCDLKINGIAQFIFREFCRRLEGCKYINIMGSSGLKNLEKVKLSYHPAREINLFSVYPHG